MNSKHRKTLAAIFAEPLAGPIEWASIERLLVAVDCAVVEGAGSRVRFIKGGAKITLHRPHPVKEAKRYQVREVRAFLERIGVKP